MTNATITAVLLSIPMALLSIAQIGILRDRLVFVVAGFFVTILTSGLLLAAGFASQMASGSGSGGTGGWEGWWPLPLFIGIALSLLIFGMLFRPKVSKLDTSHDEPEMRLPTLREVED